MGLEKLTKEEKIFLKEQRTFVSKIYLLPLIGLLIFLMGLTVPDIIYGRDVDSQNILPFLILFGAFFSLKRTAAKFIKIIDKLKE